MINNFLDRNEPVRPTMALEYSFARRSSASGQTNQKLVSNIWELGSLANSAQLIEVPIKSHGLENFAAIIMLNLGEPEELLNDLESALQGLKQSFSEIYSEKELLNFKQKILDEESSKEHPDINKLDIMPCKTVIVGGMYDKFENLEPEVRKHVVRFLRSISHSLGAALVFYSSKKSSLAKTMRDVMCSLSFGSPKNPIRSHQFDYNEPVLVGMFNDSWEKIGDLPSNSERLAITFSSHIQQNKPKEYLELDDPAKDVNFREPAIDDLRAIKDEELFRLIKTTEVKAKFDSFSLANSPFNYTN